MRTFRLTPTLPGQHAHHAWTLIAREEDGSETTIETYPTRAEAEAAIAALEQVQRDDPA